MNEERRYTDNGQDGCVVLGCAAPHTVPDMHAYGGGAICAPPEDDDSFFILGHDPTEEELRKREKIREKDGFLTKLKNVLFKLGRYHYILIWILIILIVMGIMIVYWKTK